MKIKVDVNNVTITEKSDIHKGEYNVNKCIFEFSSEYTKDLIYRAVFSCINGSYYQLILNNECDIPDEVLKEKDVNIEIGIYAYILNDDNELELRYSPRPTYFRVENGSYKDADKAEVSSPTDYEKFLNEFNRNANEKTEQFNDNATQKLKEYNENADKKTEEINNIEDNIEETEKRVSASEQNTKTSETNAKTSESNAQNSAKKASEIETNIISIQEDINASKSHIDSQKESVDNSVKNVEKLVDEATNQANISKEQAEISTINAAQTSKDRTVVETMKSDVSSMKTSVEQTKTDTEQIKNDTQALKEETLQAKEEVENSLENERIISDNKYARALKTKVEDVEQTQIYAENPEVENLVIRGAELTQKTREGYNLVDFKSPDEIYVSDFNFQNDILTITSSSGTFRQIMYDITNLMLANAGKVLSFWYSNIDFSQGKSPAVQITLTKNDNTKSYTQLLSASLVKSNFNIPDNISEYSSLKLGILCNNTSESSNASITIIKPMLLIGIEEKPYEEYGASPSLDYPSEIQVAKEQNISIEGKNKCRGWMNTTLTAVYGSAFLIKADLKPNTKYTISFLTPTFKAEYYRAEELTSNWFTVINNGKRQSCTFTTKADISNAYKEYNGEYGYILFKNAIATPSPANFSDVMLVEGDTDVPYEPYYGHDVNIPLTNNSIGNYFDVIDRENKVQDKVIQELILTGNENYNFNNVENGIYQYSITPAKKPIYINDSIIRVMSNYFKGVGRNGSWNIDNSITLNMSNIRFMTSQYTTVEDFKAKIKELYEAGKPVKIYYVSETIDKIPLSEEIKQELNKFKLYDDLNNVLIDKGSLSFKYNKSLSKELEEKDEMIDNLLTRVQVLEQAQVNSVGGN
mgnify:CR=1 FL=1